MKCEFHRGDIVCRIGDTRPFIVLDFQEPGSDPVWPVSRYRLMEVEEDKWGRNITFHNRLQVSIEMTCVKIGEWDFNKDKEADDEGRR